MDDVSALLDAASAPADPTPAPDPTPDPIDTDPVQDADTDAAPDDSTADPSDAAEVPDAGTDPDEKPVDGRTNPAAIRSALKAFRDLDPKNAPLAKELNNAYGRYTAYREVFPKVADAQQARALLDAVGGDSGLASLQETIKSVNATDAKLFAGDGSVLKEIYEDMKKDGQSAGFFKLASPMLDLVKTENPEAYHTALKPHFFRGLVDVNLPGVLGALGKALSGDAPDLATAKSILGNMTEWFDGLRNSVETEDKTKLDPEREAFLKERSEFQSSKQKEFQTGVATSCETHNNQSLGKELSAYLKLPFFKSFPREALVDIGNGLKSSLFSELKNDKTYQSQMDAFWSAKNPDKAAIEKFHADTVKARAKRIVKSLLDTRYPNFSKGSQAAGAKAVKAPVKPGAPNAAPVAGKPQYVSVKPASEQIDWDKDPERLLFITGKAYLKGSNKLVAWHPKYK